MIRSDGEDPVKRLENLRHLRQENLVLMQNDWAAFATATPVASLDPGISRSAVLEDYPTEKPGPQAASGMDQATVSRAVELSVDVRAVRDFLERTSRLAGDLIGDLITKGGIVHLDDLRRLTVEDLTHPERSIIAPRVIPMMRARILIQEIIPRMSHPANSHDRMNEIFSPPVAHLGPVHVLSPEHVISHGPILLGSSPASASTSESLSPLPGDQLN